MEERAENASKRDKAQQKGRSHHNFISASLRQEPKKHRRHCRKTVVELNLSNSDLITRRHPRIH